MATLAGIAMGLAAIAMLQCLAGWLAVVRFAARPRRPGRLRPPITVLKPLHGDEPLLEQALETLCHQRYPVYQVVFGVQIASDPAAGVVRRLQSRFPGCDLKLVVDPTQHGRNQKVGNLINMLRLARHDVLVIADSDLHVTPDYLERLAAALEPPATGVATTLYVGLPATQGISPLLGATQITHCFLPGALLARWLGRQDCLGATMALRRDTLRRIGGLEALVDHLADDNALGRLVQGVGLAVRLADTVPLTTIGETNITALFRHELRWARTISALAPLPFAASVLQYPIFLALFAALLAPWAAWAWVGVCVAWALRAAAARGIDRALGRVAEMALPAPALWLLPLRELMSVVVMIASYGGTWVEWRGITLEADGPAKVPAALEKDGRPG